MRRAQIINCSPSYVKVTPLELRTTSRTPSSSSSCISWRDRVGCVRWSSAAARVMFSSRATVKKYFSVRNSTGPHLLFSPTISWPQWGRKCDMCEMYVSA